MRSHNTLNTLRNDVRAKGDPRVLKERWTKDRPHLGIRPLERIYPKLSGLSMDKGLRSQMQIGKWIGMEK